MDLIFLSQMDMDWIWIQYFGANEYGLDLGIELSPSGTSAYDI